MEADINSTRQNDSATKYYWLMPIIYALSGIILVAIGLIFISLNGGQNGVEYVLKGLQLISKMSQPCGNLTNNSIIG